jgi:hypothetical protein
MAYVRNFAGGAQRNTSSAAHGHEVTPHVRFGSLADICSAKWHVRFALKQLTMTRLWEALPVSALLPIATAKADMKADAPSINDLSEL